MMTGISLIDELNLMNYDDEINRVFLIIIKMKVLLKLNYLAADYCKSIDS